VRVRTSTARGWPVPLAIGLGLAALAARSPSWGAVGVTMAVGLVGVVVPLPGRRETGAFTSGGGASVWWGALLLGLAAVVAVAWLPEAFSVPAGRSLLLAGVAAAIAEEAFFRRLAYGWLARWGDALAIWVSAAAFALVHLPAYGPQILPIDFAAGLLFGWQRWMTGGWSAPALTHVAANLLA
jgi:membrane protease YdiL (CAAX protease family)